MSSIQPKEGTQKARIEYEPFAGRGFMLVSCRAQVKSPRLATRRFRCSLRRHFCGCRHLVSYTFWLTRRIPFDILTPYLVFGNPVDVAVDTIC
jgi:hypothetical protein